MAVNFKKLISYSIDNKYEKIYNYLKINRHLELTKDDIDKIMDLDFDIKLKIQFIQKIKEEIERLKMEFVSDTELQNAKDRLKGSFIIALETNSEKASTIGQFEAMGFGYNFCIE